MKPYSLYKQMIPRYYLEPIDASEQIFSVIGNGLAWTAKGEIGRCVRLKDDTTYKSFSHNTIDRSGELKTRYDIMNEAKQIRRDFVNRNLRKILRGSKVASYFRSNTRTDSYYVRHPHVKYALGLNFPDNITKEWAVILLEYLRWWSMQLRIAYGVGHSSEIDHWPALIQDAHSHILSSIERLYPTVYGLTYAQHEKMMLDAVDEVLKRKSLS